MFGATGEKRLQRKRRTRLHRASNNPSPSFFLSLSLSLCVCVRACVRVFFRFVSLRCDSLRRGAGSRTRAGFGSVGRRLVTKMPVAVPRVPYRTPQEGNWQWVDLWNCLYRERIIFVGQGITEELGNQLVGTLLYLDSVSQKDLQMYVLATPRQRHALPSQLACAWLLSPLPSTTRSRTRVKSEAGEEGRKA